MDKGGADWVNFDSTTLSVCDNHRIHNHKVFAEFAERGKGSMGWFYGFNLHLVINDCGELLACQITPANVDDRKPVSTLCKRLFGKLSVDRGYASQPLFEPLLETFGVQLITQLKKNMKKRLLRKRAILESVVDQLKNISQIEHSRHRSPINGFIYIMAGLAPFFFLSALGLNIIHVILYPCLKQKTLERSSNARFVKTDSIQGFRAWLPKHVQAGRCHTLRTSSQHFSH
jgi:hypothetical protein